MSAENGSQTSRRSHLSFWNLWPPGVTILRTGCRQTTPGIPKHPFIYLKKTDNFSKAFIYLSNKNKKNQFCILHCPLNLIRHYKATKKRFLTHCISGWDKTTFTVRNLMSENLVYLPCPWIWMREPRHLAAPVELELVLWRTEKKHFVTFVVVPLTGLGTLKTLLIIMGAVWYSC